MKYHSSVSVISPAFQKIALKYPKMGLGNKKIKQKAVIPNSLNNSITVNNRINLLQKKKLKGKADQND